MGWITMGGFRLCMKGQDEEAEETAVPKAVNYLRQFVPGG